jgi:uncharacterized cupredoxin-like copper-binding protein
MAAARPEIAGSEYGDPDRRARTEGGMMKRSTLFVAVLAAVVVPVASAHGKPDAVQPQTVQSATLLEKVNVTASEFKFVLSKKTARRGVVVFKVKNVGKLKHDFDIKGRKTRLLAPGQTETLRVTFLRKGSYPYKCTVAGHAAAGMKGVFKIT